MSKPSYPLKFHLDQEQAPYYAALQSYVDTGVIPFHVPGHCQGRGSPEPFRSFIRQHGLAADITQVLGMDDIHAPRTEVKLAQELAADAYGADHTFFLINGSSAGNHAMILACLNPGDRIIVPRNAHRSTTGAIILSGAVPAYINPEYDAELFIDHTTTPEEIERALDEQPEARAVLVVSPTYYGITADLAAIERIVHARNRILLVDEAWGPHLRFHPALPISSMEAGADLAVNSTHKLISGMSQASMLHHKGERVDLGRLQAVLRLFLSTSPSCLLVASLDTARRQMALEGEALLSRAIALAEEAREKINALGPYYCFGNEVVGRPGAAGYDPTRLTITVTNLGYSGYDMERILRWHYNIQIEMSDLHHVVALITIGHGPDELRLLLEALEDIAGNGKNYGDLISSAHLLSQKRILSELPDWPPQRMTPREAFLAPFETVPLHEAVGRICCEIITPYPPGIPVLRPGDQITRDLVGYLELELQAGISIQGPVDPTLTTIRVVKERHRAGKSAGGDMV